MQTIINGKMKKLLTILLALLMAKAVYSQGSANVIQSQTDKTNCVMEKNKTYIYKYPRPAVTADCVVMTNEAEPKVLLIQRGFEPYKDCWAFPGGFMNMDETVEQCAVRELEEETGLRISDIRQIGVYSKVDRDPRGRIITVAFLAVVDEPVKVSGHDDARKAEWWPVNALPPLAFDHEDIMENAITLYKGGFY